MAEKKSFPDEMYEWKANKYKNVKRTKHPHQVEMETCRRVNNLVRHVTPGVKLETDFARIKRDELLSGRLPADLFDTKMVYNDVSRTITITGPGGSFVLDDSTCMVDLACYFINFIQPESCGACTFCRLGTKQMLDILERIRSGKGETKDIERLEVLAEKIESSSLCELGKTAANPVLMTIRNFRSEYKEHIEKHKCRAGKCEFGKVAK